MFKIVFLSMVFVSSLSACPQLDKVKRYIEARIKEESEYYHDSEVVDAYKDVLEYIESIEPRSLRKSLFGVRSIK